MYIGQELHLLTRWDRQRRATTFGTSNSSHITHEHALSIATLRLLQSRKRTTRPVVVP